MARNDVAGLLRTLTHVGTRRAALGLLALALGGARPPGRSCTNTRLNADCIILCCPDDECKTLCNPWQGDDHRGPRPPSGRG